MFVMQECCQYRELDLARFVSHSVKYQTMLDHPHVCACIQVEKALDERKNEVETLRQQVSLNVLIR